MANTRKKTAPSTRTKRTAPETTEKSLRTKPAAREKVLTEQTEQTEQLTSTPKKSRGIKLRKSYVITVLALIALGLVLYALRGYFIVATVNGQPITRLGVIKELEKQHGKEAVDSLTIKALVEQEAAKKHLSVSQDDVNKELKKNEDILKKNGQTLDQFLQSRGLSKAYYLEGLRLQLLAKKIVGPAKITDKQITDYIEQNKDRFAQYTKLQEQKQAAKDELDSQEVGQKINDWLQKVRTEAKINYIYQY